MCDHADFRAQVNVHRLPAEEGGPVNAISADIRVWCADCGQPMQFIGPVVGDLADELAVSADRTELRVPLTYEGAPDGFGRRPGYRMRSLFGQENN